MDLKVNIAIILRRASANLCNCLLKRATHLSERGLPIAGGAAWAGSQVSRLNLGCPLKWRRVARRPSRAIHNAQLKPMTSCIELEGAKKQQLRRLNAPRLVINEEIHFLIVNPCNAHSSNGKPYSAPPNGYPKWTNIGLDR